MPSTTVKSAFWSGFRAGLPFVFVAGPFGLLFGVLATEAGLNVAEALFFSATIFAGAAQFTALQMMQEQAPTIIVLASALAVNLRVAMYSASLTPYLGAAPLWQRALAAYMVVDQSYACAVARYETEPDMGVSARLAYFFGVVSPLWPLWIAATLFGAMVGARIPDSWGLDFALPIAFLAMLAPMLRTPAHLAAAFTGAVMSLLTAGLPWNLGLIVSGIAGMMVGAQAELWLIRRGRFS